MKTIEEQFIDVIISKINAGWFWTNLIRMALTKGVAEGLKALRKISISLQDEVWQLMLKYVEADEKGMIDEAADVLAEIVKLIFYPTKKR
jgi:hypothetical protein